jgi:excisionase family DNA binding protein
MDMEANKMLTVAKCAEQTGLKEPTIRLWMAQRKIAYVKLGRSVRIPQAEIDRLIQQNTVPVLEEATR